jgi:cytochrome c oxidase subunit 3
VKKTDLQNNLAMTITLVMGSMLFATLFMGYAIYRTSASVWPPLGIPKVSLLIPFLSTIVIVMSSWFMAKVRENVKVLDLINSNFYLNLTLAFGCIFLLLQSFLWFHLKSTGVFVGTSGIFGSILYGFTWIHALHMILGVSGLVYLKFKLTPSGTDLLQKSVNVEKFWHFLGVIWIIMFLTIFVL